MNKHWWVPPAVMVNGIVTSMILLVGMSALATCAQAKPVVLGTFNGDVDAYEDSTVIYDKNIRSAWIITSSKKFNYSHDALYAGALGRFMMDCAGYTTVFAEVATVNIYHKTTSHKLIAPGRRWILPIVEHTPQAALWKALCVSHPYV